MGRDRRFLIGILAVLGGMGAPTGVALAGSEAVTAVDAEAIDEVFASWNRSDGPGCVCAVSNAERVLLEKAYGMANLELGIPLTPVSVFYVASVAKEFTAASVALLADRGEFSLDDDARGLLPQLAGIGTPVTIRQLAQHASGVRDYFGLLRLAGSHSLDYIDQTRVLDLLARQTSLQFEPGSRHEYSNSNYVLLAELVRRVGGVPFPEFASTRIFSPLGMTRTRFMDDHTLVVPGRVASYRASEDGYHRHVMEFDVVGDGGLLSTAGDLTAWGRDLLDPTAISAWARAELGRPGVTSSGESFPYGLGHRLDLYRGMRTIGHTGSFKGFMTRLVVLPDRNLVVAVLCNAEEASAVRLSEAVLDTLVPHDEAPAAEASAPASPVNLTEEDLSRWAGHYWSDDGAVAREIYARDGTLFYGRGGKDSPLSPLAADRFGMPGFDIPITLEFGRDADGLRGFELRIADFQTSRYREYTPIDRARFSPERFTGRYASEELSVSYSVVLDEGTLWLEIRGHPRAELRPVMEDLLVATVDELAYVLRFDRRGGAPAAGFALDSGWIHGLLFTRRNARPDDA